MLQRWTFFYWLLECSITFLYISSMTVSPRNLKKKAQTVLNQIWTEVFCIDIYMFTCVCLDLLICCLFSLQYCLYFPPFTFAHISRSKILLLLVMNWIWYVSWFDKICVTVRCWANVRPKIIWLNWRSGVGVTTLVWIRVVTSLRVIVMGQFFTFTTYFYLQLCVSLVQRSLWAFISAFCPT